MGHRFLVESTTIENVISRYKTALSKANVMTNKIGIPIWTCHKEQSFVSNYSIFFENLILVMLYTYKELI